MGAAEEPPVLAVRAAEAILDLVVLAGLEREARRALADLHEENAHVRRPLRGIGDE